LRTVIGFDSLVEIVKAREPLLGYTRQLPQLFTSLVCRIPSEARAGWPFAAITAATQ
jgi:hypothetical protein